MSNPIGWFEIYVEEMQRAKAFYEAVLQVTLTQMENPDPEGFAEMEMWAFPYEPEGPGASGALVKMPGYAPGKGGTLVYFSCEDCSVETARAVAHGGTLVGEKMSIGESGFVAMVKDTEGNEIGFHSMQ